MRRHLILASLLVIASVARLSAAFPAIIMLYGGSLKEPIFVVNRTVAEGGKHGFLSCNYDPSLDAPVSPGLEQRPYIGIAIFWNNQVWRGYMDDPALLQTLKPEQAYQHGRLYLPQGDLPGTVVITDARQLGLNPPPTPIPQQLTGFARGCDLSADDVQIASELLNPQAPVRPSFAGMWTLDHVSIDPRMRTGSGPDFMLGEKFVIEQTASSISLTQRAPRNHPRVVIPLDGSAGTFSLPNPNEAFASWSFSARVTWEGDSLLMTAGAGPVGGLLGMVARPGWDLVSRWSLTPSGQLSILDLQPNIEVRDSVTHLLYVKR